MRHFSTANSPDQSGGRPTVLKLVDSRIVALTAFKVGLFGPWRWLRGAYDRGMDRPDLVVFMAAATLRVWWQSLTAVATRIRGGRRT